MWGQPHRLSFERGSKPCSSSEGKVSSPMFGCISRVSGAIASFRKPPLPCVSGASLPFTSAHASFRIKLTLRFRHQAIALFRKLSLRFGNPLRFVSGIARDAVSSLGLKSPLGPSPVLFPLPRVTSNLALAIQISNHDRGQDGPLPSKPPRLKPFVSKSLIPKSFGRGRLRRTFRYNDDSKDVEKRGEGVPQPFTHQIGPTLPGHPGDFHIYSGQKSTALISGNPVPRKQTTSRKKSESRMGGMVYDAPVLLSYLPNRSWSLQEHH